MIKVVLVGCGSISREELLGLTSHPDVSVVGLVDVVLENASKRKTEFELEAAETSTDFEATLIRHQPDIVVDCTPPHAHSDIACMAMRHGAHVLGQKPMADTLANAHRAIQASRDTGLVYGVIQTGRFEEQARTLRAFVGGGAIGDVTTVEFRYFTGMHFPAGDFRNTMRHVLLLDMSIPASGIRPLRGSRETPRPWLILKWKTMSNSSTTAVGVPKV
jgi:predicted dehydrogenase